MTAATRERRSDVDKAMTVRRAPWLTAGAVTLLTALLAAPACDAQGAGGPRLDLIELPAGFRIDVYAEGVPDARSLTLSDAGVVYVGTRSGNRRTGVYALRDRDGDQRAEEVIQVADELLVPNGVAWRDGDLYVAEIDRVLRYRDLDQRLDDPPEPEVVIDGLPDDRWHGWKFIAFGPDGKLYVPVGAPCNVCERDLPYMSILHAEVPDAGEAALEPFALGVRNTVGFAWHPRTGELWFTDNGRDMMGDDVPPDELNRAPRAGMHFGFPYCHGEDISDPEHGAEKPCSELTPPVQELGPHVAALGMRFYTGDQFPERYRDQIFIAEHGSWNRSQKIGYRVMLVTLDGEGRAVSYQPFAEGWLQSEDNWGRPVDVLVMPDGALLVSDDQGGVVYRISYAGDAARPSAD